MHGNTEICYIKIFPKQGLISFQGLSRDDYWIENAQNWQIGWSIRRELFTLQKGRDEQSNSKELPATLVRDFKWPRQWCQSVVLSDLIAFIWRRSICQNLAYFLGVKFTFVRYRKWSTIANDPKTVPQMIPKMDLKWSSTVNDPRCQTQMIPEGKSECMAWT